ncbi:Uncaracterized surface protein containing fasciclin (FAS1) repeats [Nocardioides terrae]|uniref:Uncaracterized surface protein containing fasciclin (FAS1) repeats n=1 Tax=Nocardioides terrae TaxID=574651 RepID=A0A1I1I540_9ACTN|nr:fasciclin domain-containing protein [Nocardioides terrae]SFC31437.1 Uncaracterized surface protein containing fasciclin (FAS1) repeats [Nocardioides terrae]
MKTTILRSTGLAAALVLSLSVAACGGSDSGSGDDAGASSSSAPMASDSSAAAMDAGSKPFGPGCSSIPTSGAGSFDGMVKDPVATAASNNPLLSTLVTAVTKADLVDTLNGADGLTVFAPTNDAFSKIPKDQLDKVLADKAMLTAILTHHVVGGKLDPTAVAGTQTTLNKDSVTVTGDASGMTVDGANVVCGNIPTANATVYVVDTVLMPPSM